MTPERPRRPALRLFGLLLGPALFALLLLLLPERYAVPNGSESLSFGGRVSLALMAWMGSWWMLEAIDVRATALLPLVVLPFSGVQSFGQTSAPYASPMIYLFLGGFLLAFGMKCWGLDRRIALTILSRVGSNPARMVGGFMAATALLSAMVSNTATCTMMLPIALSVADLFGDRKEQVGQGFQTALLLGIAYAASIGGLATKIGSPPNGIMSEICRNELGIEISFARWLLIGVPLSLVFLPLAWWLLVRILHRLPRQEIPGAAALLAEEHAALGPMNRGEKIVQAVFCGAVALWIGRPFLRDQLPQMSDAGIAIAAGLLLFVIPVNRDFRPVLRWRETSGLPWGILLLFGGGLSLAAAVKAHGVDRFIGSQVALLNGMPVIVLVVVVTAFVVFLTEVTSNTATAATLIPLLAGLAQGLEVAPMILIVPATLAASCAFMLPVATPPNAIVFGSGHIRLGQMSRAGFWLNLVAIGLITLLVYAVVIPFLLS